MTDPSTRLVVTLECLLKQVVHRDGPAGPTSDPSQTRAVFDGLERPAQPHTLERPLTGRINGCRCK